MGISQYLALRQLIGKRAVRRLHAQMHLFADVFQPRIAHQRPWQQASLSQDLKPVADAQHQSASGGKLLHRLHHRRKPSNRPGAQIVAIRKAARNQHRIHALQILRVVPEKRNRLLRNLRDHVVGVVVAIGPRKDQNAEFHASRLTVWEEQNAARFTQE